MSRTKHDDRHTGKEYWSARPGNKNGGLLGSYSKRKTHRAERRANKRLCKED